MRRTNNPHIANRDLSPDRKVSVTEKIRRILLPGNTQPAKRSVLLSTCRPEIRKENASPRIANQSFLARRRRPAFVKRARENGRLATSLNRQAKTGKNRTKWIVALKARKVTRDNMPDEMRNGRQSKHLVIYDARNEDRNLFGIAMRDLTFLLRSRLRAIRENYISFGSDDQRHAAGVLVKS